MKFRTGRPLTFNCPGTIKGWWTRCIYPASWFAARLHSCLFNLLTYLLWSSASTVVNVAADDDNRERGRLKMSIRDHLNVWKDHPLTSAALVLIHSFPTRKPEADPGGLEEHRLYNHSRSKWSFVAEMSMTPSQISAWKLQLPICSQQLPAIFTY